MRSKRIPGWAQVLGTAAAALAFLLVYELAVYRVPLQQIFLPCSYWSDEVIYSKQLAAVVRCGAPQGYFGFNESHAASGTFAAWGPAVFFVYALPGLFLRGQNAFLWCNLLFVVAGWTFFARAARLNGKQQAVFAAALAAFNAPIRYVFSAMQEPLHYALVLAVLGCGVFTAYAAGLFFRQRSRETGVFLALGASRGQVQALLLPEVCVLGLTACGAGAVLGVPLAFGLWQLFRAFVVDSGEMPLRFDFGALAWPLAFAAYTVLMLLWMGRRSVRRASIMEVVRQSHTAEPVRAVPRFYGWLGILLTAAGCLCGYLVPTICVRWLHWYAPAIFTAPFYLPALAGLYMMLLHTVANGWGRRAAWHRDILSVSMMRFEGRQTVRNMLVMTVLIGGACFAGFYAPMLGTGSMLSYDARPVDFAFHYRADQDMPQKDEVLALAEEYGMEVTHWAEAPMARLGVDGEHDVETEGPLGTTWEAVYSELDSSELFLSESGWNALTGESVDIAPGQAAAVLDASGSSQGRFSPGISLVTNTVTGRRLHVSAAAPLRSDMLFRHFVLDDGDWAAMTAGLPGDWREQMVFFDATEGGGEYAFAKALFNEIVDRSGPEVALHSGWDPVVRQRCIEEEGSYFLDRETLLANGESAIDYALRDSSEFRLFWQYMPQFRALDKADFVRTLAVFLMLFLFISTVCFAAAAVIGFVRSLTIALENRRVYGDLRRLGVSADWMRRSARSQVRRVFTVPTAAGIGLMYAFYGMIMFFNDGSFTAGELAGLVSCLGLAAAVAAALTRPVTSPLGEASR